MAHGEPRPRDPVRDPTNALAPPSRTVPRSRPAGPTSDAVLSLGDGPRSGFRRSRRDASGSQGPCGPLPRGAAPRDPARPEPAIDARFDATDDERTMADIYEMAKELGGALARTEEYKKLSQASEALNEDRELVELRNRLQELEERIESGLRQGRQPEDEVKEAYEEAASELQGKPGFQKLIAAQSNFEKVMQRVNQTMAQGMQEGAASRIILSS